MMSVEPVLDATFQTVITDVPQADPSNLTVVDVSGTFPCGSTRCSDATKMSVTPREQHSFILLVRRGMFELYVDGLLVQYHVYGECAFTQSGAQLNVSWPWPKGKCLGGNCRECGGRIGLAVNGTAVSVNFLRGWQMSLSMFPV